MTELDLFDVRRARHAPGLLRAFNDIGVLTAADVHVAVRIAALAEETDETVALAAALAVRAPRLGHVFVDLATIRETAAVESDEPVDLTTLPWPEVEGWTLKLEASPLVAVGEEGDREPPAAARRQLALPRSLLARGAPGRRRPARASAARRRSTRRGWRRPGAALPPRARARQPRRPPGDRDERQRAAAAAAVRRRFAVVAGGPGTGKTTTVARIVALLAEQAEAAGARAAAGRARGADRQGGGAARGGGPRRGANARRPLKPSATSCSRSRRRRCTGCSAGGPTATAASGTTGGNRLPHDVVIVDETSMVSLSLMARLVEAVRPEARLVLVGDPGQLTSIEAGAVLGDIVRRRGRGRRRARARLPLRRRDRRARGRDPQRRRRRGDRRADRRATRTSRGSPVDVADPAAQDALGAGPRRRASPPPRAVIAGGARRRRGGGDPRARRVPRALRAPARRLRRERLDGADRGLARGRARTRALVPRPPAAGDRERLRAAALQRRHGRDRRHGRRPRQRGLRAPRRGRRCSPPARLGAVDTVYAMTVHKSQGSQFGTAAVLLPAAGSRS